MDTKDEPFDLDDFRMTPEIAAAMHKAKAAKPAKAQPRRSRHRDFVMVPLVWVERLKGSTSAAAWPIAIYLLYQDWRSGGKPVPMSNVTAKALGITRWAKWNALQELKARGLILIETRPRRSPLVLVLKSCRLQPHTSPSLFYVLLTYFLFSLNRYTPPTERLSWVVQA